MRSHEPPFPRRVGISPAGVEAVWTTISVTAYPPITARFRDTSRVAIREGAGA
jgi:hypothetical protein